MLDVGGSKYLFNNTKNTREGCITFGETVRVWFIPSAKADSNLYTMQPVAPVAYQVILEPGIGQFREFEPRRVHTRINSLGLFLVDYLTSGKRESVS